MKYILAFLLLLAVSCTPSTPLIVVEVGMSTFSDTNDTVYTVLLEGANNNRTEILTRTKYQIGDTLIP